MKCLNGRHRIVGDQQERRKISPEKWNKEYAGTCVKSKALQPIELISNPGSPYFVFSLEVKDVIKICILELNFKSLKRQFCKSVLSYLTW